MLRQRWILRNVIILFYCIMVSESFFLDHEENDPFASAIENFQNDVTIMVNEALNLKNDLLDNFDKSGILCLARVLDFEWLTGINLSSIVSDMQMAQRQGNDEQWRDSMDRMFNVQRIVQEIRSSKITKVSCIACRFLMKAAQFFMLIGQSDQDIAELATNICIALGPFFEAKDPSFCRGIMKSIGLDAIYAIRHANMEPAQICTQFLGDACLCGYSKLHDWTINLPNSKKLANHITTPPTDDVPKLKVLQITDIHYDPYYQPGSESDCDFPACCRASVGYPARSPETAAGKWGDYRKCDSPKRLIENAFQHIAETHKDIDYILWTGDIPPHDIWNQSREENLKNLRLTSELIAKYFGNTNILPAVGNHESFPIDSFLPSNLRYGRNMQFLYDQLTSEWSRWLPPQVLDTVRYGGYYSVLVRPGFRIISVNGNYCGRNSFLLMINSTDPYGQLAWLTQELEMAEINGEKVHIINHVPPGQPDCLKAWSHNYYKIINRFEGIIMAQFYGHTHYDEFEVFYDTSDLKRPVNVGYISPSITPWKDCNPAYRIYYVDGDHPKSTRAIIDFETWTMDLDHANRYDDPHWFKSYEARKEYDMKSLLPKDWDDLIRRMAVNRTLFDLYHRNYYRDSPTMPKCDRDCKRDLLCDLRSGRSHDKKNLCRNL